MEDTKLVGVITGSIAIGKTVDMGGYTWLVCHVSRDEAYLILNTIYEKTIFNNSPVYSGSILQNKCSTFYNTLPSNVKNILSSSSVNVPTYSQCNGGFSYFNNNTNRIARDTSGTAVEWWTSTIADTTYAGYAYYIDSSGSIKTTRPRNSSYGFRPYVIIPL